jgi:hypothetical protein
LLALLFMLLAAFPGQLLNNTVSEHYGEISGWFALGGSWTRDARNALSGFWQTRLGLAVFVIGSGLLFGFLSPSFGATVESAASLVGIVGGLVLILAAFELPRLLVHRRFFRDPGRLIVQPLTIVIAVVCVLISRLAEFQPGYLYGLVIGFAFARELSARNEGRLNALTALWVVLLSLLAWLLLPFAASAVGAPSLIQVALSAGLATVFVAGLEGVLFELVPLSYLRGESVFGWRRSVWAILFVTAAFAFVHILLTPANGYLGDSRTSPLLAAVILFFGFGGFSVAFWAYFRFRPTAGATAEVAGQL